MDKFKRFTFLFFLTINAILWTCISLTRNLISTDAMEAIVWGELFSFGTNKHPPLSGWLMAGSFNLFGQHDFIAYILGQICIIVGLVFVYKLAKFFLSEEKAICASLFLTCCYYYTYTYYLDNFNCNFLSMAIWPAIAYFYYKACKEGLLKDWIFFGITCGLGVLAKYQVVFLFLALLFHFLAFERRQFRKAGMYIAILCGSIVIAPHVIWLFKNDFFSFAYMELQAVGSSVDESISFAKRFFMPIKFVADQFLSLVICFIIYIALLFQTKKIQLQKHNPYDKFFIISICFLPAIAQGLMGAFTGNIVHGVWGSIMVSFSGIALFYFVPLEFNSESFKFYIKSTAKAILLLLIAIGIFSQIQVKRKILYPYQTIHKDIYAEWNKQTDNAPLKYVSGDLRYTFQFRVYEKNPPKVILDTFGYINPWTDYEDVFKSGVIVFATLPQDLLYFVNQPGTLLPTGYKIAPIEYKYEIKNIFNKKKHLKFYYAIIPPGDT